MNTKKQQEKEFQKEIENSLKSSLDYRFKDLEDLEVVAKRKKIDFLKLSFSVYEDRINRIVNKNKELINEIKFLNDCLISSRECYRKLKSIPISQKLIDVSESEIERLKVLEYKTKNIFLGNVNVILKSLDFFSLDFSHSSEFHTEFNIVWEKFEVLNLEIESSNKR